MKSLLKKTKDDLWDTTRTIVFLRYPDVRESGKNKGKRKCYTCKDGAGYSCGHFLPAVTLPSKLRYELEYLRPQCWPCQKHKQGNFVGFVRNLRNEGIDGIVLAKELIDRADLIKDEPAPKVEWYAEKLAQYNEIVKEFYL